MSRNNFDSVWRSFRKGRKKLSCTFLRKLKEIPTLYDRAINLNKDDNFVMHNEKKENSSKGSETSSVSSIGSTSKT